MIHSGSFRFLRGIWVGMGVFAVWQGVVSEPARAAQLVSLPCQMGSAAAQKGEQSGIKPCQGADGKPGLIEDFKLQLREAVIKSIRAYYQGKDAAFGSNGEEQEKKYQTPVCSFAPHPANYEAKEGLLVSGVIAPNHLGQACGDPLNVHHWTTRPNFGNSNTYRNFQLQADGGSNRGQWEGAMWRGVQGALMWCGALEGFRQVEEGRLDVSEVPSGAVSNVAENTQRFMEYSARSTGSAGCAQQSGPLGAGAGSLSSNKACYSGAAQQSSLAAVVRLAYAQIMLTVKKRMDTVQRQIFEGQSQVLNQGALNGVVQREIRSRGRRNPGRQLGYQEGFVRTLRESVDAVVPAECKEMFR